MTDENSTDPVEGFLANLLARRFFDLLRARGEQLTTVAGGVRFLTFKVWHETPEADRDALSDVFLLLMREAREQREDWTRAFIEAEIVRLRESIELREPDALRRIGAPTPGRFTRIRERESGDGFVYLIPDTSREPSGRLHLLECSNRLCTWRNSTHERQPGDPCDNPRGCSGVYVLASPEGRVDDARDQLAARLFQLRDSLQRAAGGYECTPEENPVSPKKTAERLNLFAVELESIIYEAGLAERPKEGA